MRKLTRIVRAYLALPPEARRHWRRDWIVGPGKDPGRAAVVDAAVGWLCRAQDASASADGGVAHHYGLLGGWSSSYPETTGYIVPTLLEMARLRGDPALRDRARRMLEWLVSLQFPDGGFAGGLVHAPSPEPVVFNTGQILLGLAAGVREFGEEYRDPMVRAADWLVSVQDPDGCWRRYPSPFARGGPRTYDTHVAWGLLEAARVHPAARYEEAALAHVRWALRFQHANGWFEHCCLTDPRRPLTHTIGYTLRGVVEAYLYFRDPALLDASRRTADALLHALRGDGFLPGRLEADWSPAARWSCLTGAAQTAACWLRLYPATNDRRYLAAARATNRFLRRTVRVDGPPDVRGAVAGSFPISGDYCHNQFPNWACKFFVDAQLLEAALAPEAGEHPLADASTRPRTAVDIG